MLPCQQALRYSKGNLIRCFFADGSKGHSRNGVFTESIGII